MATNIYYPTSNKGYINYENKVQAIVIESFETIAKSDGCTEFRINANVGGKDTELTTGALPTIYPTESDAIRRVNEIGTREFDGHAKNLIGYPTNTLYVFENGEVVSKTRSALNIKFVATNEGESWEATFSGYDYVYDSYDICNKSYDVEVVEEDGTTHIHKSAKSRVTLTEEQKSKVDALIKAMKELRGMGVRMIMETDTEQMTFINAKDVEFSYGYEDDEEYGESFLVIPKAQRRVSVPVDFLYSDDSIYIKA